MLVQVVFDVQDADIDHVYTEDIEHYFKAQYDGNSFIEVGVKYKSAVIEVQDIQFI